MGSEILLYGYGAVCASMLVFNVVYNIAMKGKDRHLEAKKRRFEAELSAQLERIRAGQEVPGDYLRRLKRRLLRVNSLIVFEQVLDGLQMEDPAASQYYRQIQPVILGLSAAYRNRDSMQAAYFAYFLSVHKPAEGQPTDEVQKMLVEYMKKDSLYCRVNALHALCQFGSPERIVEAVSLMDLSGKGVHEKILTDGLLSYTGDHEELIRQLWGKFGSFSGRVRLAVLNYIRFCSGKYCERVWAIMTDQTEDKELRLSAIRYFGRYHYEPAKEPLLAFAADPDPLKWEYAAVSILSLAGYEGGEVRKVLMEATHSSNWYVRKNAAASLEKQKLDYSDLMEIMGGNDRYAREMMAYQLDARRLEAKGTGQEEKA